MISKLLPGLNILTQYSRSYLTGDITAGIIVAILFIPQSMAYAVIAGVPPVIGLYAGTFPLLVYVIFGTSRHLSVGPVSIVSILAFSGVAAIAEPNSTQLINFIIALGLMVGFIQLFMSLINIGYLFNHISHAVIGGFTSAAAIVIAVNQVDSILGITLSSYKSFDVFISEIFAKLPLLNLYSTGIGLGSIVLLVLFKKYLKLALGPLLVIAISTLFVATFQLHQAGLKIVGNVPKGLPEFTFPILSIQDLQLLLPTAFAIAFISFLESYAVAKAVAEKDNAQLSANHELVGIGLANITSTLVGSIPVAGALSRTAVNYQSGAKTNLSSLITALLIFTTLLLFTSFFFYLPKAALAAIIIVAVTNLIEFKQFVLLVRTTPFDAFIFIITFIGTLLVDIFFGLLIGIVLSILFSLLKKTVFQIAYNKSKN